MKLLDGVSNSRLSRCRGNNNNNNNQTAIRNFGNAVKVATYFSTVNMAM
jgi:hypothetical protein